ncbi:hypothetical protein HDU92_001074 [Lobulomyces angularis]|nr:hypothetical protein HDU92_001074 [Lobulomyces angularis]
MLSSGDRRALVDHFPPFISAYKNQINYQGEGVRYFQQLTTYILETFETNIKVNIQKNFIKKIKTLITELIRIISLCKDSDLEPGISDQSYLMEAILMSSLLPPNIHVNGIPYDITTRPEAYFNSYIALGRLFDQYGLRSFNAFPLSTSTVPRYWSPVFNLNNKAFKRKRGEKNELSFTGMIRTDLVGVSVNIGLTIDAGMNANPMDVVVPHSTCDTTAFKIYLRSFFSEDFDRKQRFYGGRVFRKLRFNTFINTKKSEEKFFENFKGSYGDGRHTTVLIGDWDLGGHTLRGQVTTKGKGFR